ncbi:class I SAM-dependent methyltransferase [Streptomyces sp. NPDC000594]|uniref:class I SAM-dependent methyltransferase n=1 Tax=Streptomyces sp. NPDC000594 TaxID=3154261 RepID=UPI003316F300
MVDHDYADPYLASLYDRLNPTEGRADFAFQLPLLMSAPAVLDVGCGTGSLLKLAREAGHTGRLVGLDPAVGMLEQARLRTDVEWILGDLSTVGWEREFDLVVMSGHAFQVFLTDEELRTVLGGIATALKEGGRFAFETRNPAAREWETWDTGAPGEGSYDTEITDATGAVVRTWYTVDPPRGDLVSFVCTLIGTGWDAPRTSRSTLRFLDQESLGRFLAGAGLVVEEQYGDWDRSPVTDASPEIITVARRGPAR